MTVAGPHIPKPVFTLEVEDDPLPWLTEQFREAGVFAQDEQAVRETGIEEYVARRFGAAPRDLARRLPTPKAMSAALGITSSIVTALSDHPKRFYVRFSPTKSTASTYLASREVIIGIRPMLDPRLTEGQRAALMVALAYHEVGHVIWTADLQARFAARYEPNDTKNKPARKVFNVIHDLLLEHQQAISFPGYAPTLRVKQAYWGKAWKVRFNSRANRLGAMVQATLYPQGTDWTVTPEAEEWFAWATDWAERCRNVKAGKSPSYLWALIDEGIARLRLDDPDEPDPFKEEEKERPDTGETDYDEEEEGEEPTFDDEDGDEDGDMTDDPLDDEDGDGEEDEDGPQRPPDPEEDEDDLDDEEDESGDDDEETGDDPATDEDEPDTEDDSEEEDEEGPDGSDDPDDEDEDEDLDDEEDDEDDQPKGSGPTGQDPDDDEDDDESDDDDEGVPGEDEDDDEEDDDEDDESDEGGDSTPGETDEEAQPDEPRDEFDDPRTPQAHPEEDEDAEVWQGRIDDYERVQVKGRDKVVVGGGAFHRREVRIIRIDR